MMSAIARSHCIIIIPLPQDWLMATWKKQNETSATDKPVLLTKDLISNSGKLDREIMYLINKAKYFVPKPKPKATNATGKSCMFYMRHCRLCNAIEEGWALLSF